jgi:hypothetical protein
VIMSLVLICPSTDHTTGRGRSQSTSEASAGSLRAAFATARIPIKVMR